MTSDQPARQRLKICYIAATTEGALWVFEQLRDLRDRYDYDVSAILNGNQGTLVQQCQAAGITIHPASFDFTSNVDLLGLPRKVMALARILRRERFDIIQTHLFHSMVIGRIAAWFADVPVRFSMIAGPFHLEAYTPRWIDRSTCWMDTGLIASCEFTRTLYRSMGVRDNRLAVIYYGPDASKFDPAKAPKADLRAEFGLDADAPLIGMVAYFYAELSRSRWTPPALYGRSVKSQIDLIHAATIVLREFPSAKFLLIGSGWQAGGLEYRERMQKLVAELGLQQSVIFTGFRTDIPALLRALDVAVQPSLSENLGGTIESLLMECPTVATRVGGMTDSVLDGKTGVLADPANPESLAIAILRLLRNPDLARKCGIAGRERMLAAFTLKQTVDNLAELYRAASARHPNGYRRWMAGGRIVMGSPLCLFIVLRYRLLDAWLLLKWDQGWRPWRRNALTLFPLKLWLYRLYAFIGRHPTSFGLRKRFKRGLMIVGIPSRTIEGISSACAKIRAAATLPPRMRLYQIYAFVGRHPTNFGIRRRIHSVWASIRAAVALPPRMRLYQIYAFVGRHPTNFGMRRRIHSVWAQIRAAVALPPRMRLYQIFAFIGRHPTNFGIRRRVRERLQQICIYITRHPSSS